MNNKIYLSSPHIGDTEQKYVKEAFSTNWIAPIGPNVDRFEKSISNYIEPDVKSCVLSSGTAAIHLALKLLNVKRDDFVLVQSFTFCGTTNPVSYIGANIIFVDSEKTTWNMCPISLENAIKDNLDKPIKAIIPVHLYGMPYQVDEIKNISIKYGIPVIEDSAEALGSSYKSIKCGAFGDISVLSFNGNKIITTSGGGAIVSNNTEYVNKAKFLSTQARDSAAHYQHSEIGYNYRMSNVLAGIGIGQMEVLDKRVQQRRRNNHRYRQFFKDIPGIKLQTEPSNDFFSNYWLTAIIIEPELTGGITREDVRIAFENKNIESRPLWKPMHLQPVYRGTKFYGEGVCEEFFEKGLCLPSSSSLEIQDFERIFDVLTKTLMKHDF
ncbi:DegT/DnrJ/EryC1/StrS family aminotransferase [Flavobacteriaceae bacterium]|nr:DegT/DnrJ/EryC1/StrS family aminotransferase [Flavobacteriaceae bacterium]